MREPRRTYPFVVVLLVIVLVSCPACKMRKYRYISLESVPGIEIVERGEPQRENIWGVSAIPSVYRLRRDRYDLQFQVDLDNYGAVTSIRVVQSSETRSALRLVGWDFGEVATPNETSFCYFFSPRGAQDTLRWVCGGSTSDKSEFISFDVVSTDGELVAKEAIPFTIKESGVMVFASGP